MRKQFFIPVMVGILALGAAQAFAQSATVVMRNGDRVQAQIIDMGRDFSLNVNGQPRRVPIGEIVLLDFTGNGRDISSEEISRANAANGYVVMRNGETFNASLQDFTGKPLIAVFSNGRACQHRRGVAHLHGFGGQRRRIPEPARQPGGRGHIRQLRQHAQRTRECSRGRGPGQRGVVEHRHQRQARATAPVRVDG